MSPEEWKKKETLWHLEKMLEIFCEHGVSELYFKQNNNALPPELK